VKYEWVEHTSELELHAEAESEVLVLHATMRALAELFGSATGEPQVHEIELAAEDRAGLLVEWLEELVFLAETAAFVPEDAELVLDNTSLRGTVRGRTGNPRPLVKAVTYHRLAFEEDNGRWHARVVLDV
jgi:SHS2 domain-containing protein